jgi:hypothetical protein
LTDLFSPITRDEFDSGLHFGHHALGFINASEARLAQASLVGNGVDRLDVPVEISRNELAVATDATLEGNKLGGLADGTNAPCDLLSVLGQALVLTACRYERLLSVLTAHGFLRGAARTVLLWLVACGLERRLHLLEARFGRGESCVGGSHFGGHGGTDGLAECMLHMEEVRRVRRSQVRFYREDLCLDAAEAIEARLGSFTPINPH